MVWRLADGNPACPDAGMYWSLNQVKTPNPPSGKSLQPALQPDGDEHRPGHVLLRKWQFTEIIDDQDGVADRYNNLASNFGIGNYHETNSICQDVRELSTALGKHPITDLLLHAKRKILKDGRRGRNFHQ